MATIDADAHVIESEETWSYLEARERDFAPVLVDIPHGNGTNRKFWAIDGRLIGTGPVSETDAVKAVRELTDVEGRLHQMDELGTDVQILYPTIFLLPMTNDPQVEAALSRSYNRWIAEAVAKAPDRLKWVVIPPTLTPEIAIDEIRFGHENGACGVFWRGIESWRLPDDPYFSPILKEVDRLGLPLCVHAANGTFDLHDAFPNNNGIWRFKVPGIMGFSAVLFSGMARQYPSMKFAFVELQAQWVPYLLKDYIRRTERSSRTSLDISTIISDNRLFIACQTDDDLEDIVKYTGPSNLIAGTDFGHADTASELLALRRLRAEHPDIPELIDLILDTNPKELYNIR